MREETRFRPWLLLDRLDDVRLDDVRGAPAEVTWRELDGPGALRYLVSAADFKSLTSIVLAGASHRLSRRVADLRDLGKQSVLALPPDEQYLAASGRTYFRDLSFDHLHRMQVDLETTGLDSSRDRIFMVALRDPAGVAQILEAHGESDADEADLIRRLVAKVQQADPCLLYTSRCV